jgi:hypothetical protein
VPNSNGRKPLTTTTATLRSIATSRPGGGQGRWQDISRLRRYCHERERRIAAMLIAARSQPRSGPYWVTATSMRRR